jgi:hypothetical protein
MTTMASKHQLESQIEAEIREYAILRGWWAAKFVAPGQTGVPDRLFIRRGRHIFLEIKRPGEEPTPKQYSKHKEMRAHGAEVYWVDNLEDAKAILK